MTSCPSCGRRSRGEAVSSPHWSAQLFDVSSLTLSELTTKEESEGKSRGQRSGRVLWCISSSHSVLSLSSLHPLSNVLPPLPSVWSEAQVSASLLQPRKGPGTPQDAPTEVSGQTRPNSRCEICRLGKGRAPWAQGLLLLLLLLTPRPRQETTVGRSHGGVQPRPSRRRAPRCHRQSARQVGRGGA